ncbi:hypothetical protein VaNZ11_015675, partial [Volvox africanus]
QKQRKRNLTKYIPDVAKAVYSVLERMAERAIEAGGGGRGSSGSALGDKEEVKPEQEATAKRRRLEVHDSRQLLPAVASHELTAATLQARLTEYVERIDTDMALEYQVQQGLAAGVAK